MRRPTARFVASVAAALGLSAFAVVVPPSASAFNCAGYTRETQVYVTFSGTGLASASFNTTYFALLDAGYNGNADAYTVGSWNIPNLAFHYSGTTLYGYLEINDDGPTTSTQAGYFNFFYCAK